MVLFRSRARDSSVKMYGTNESHGPSHGPWTPPPPGQPPQPPPPPQVQHQNHPRTHPHNHSSHPAYVPPTYQHPHHHLPPQVIILDIQRNQRDRTSSRFSLSSRSVCDETCDKSRLLSPSLHHVYLLNFFPPVSPPFLHHPPSQQPPSRSLSPSLSLLPPLSLLLYCFTQLRYTLRSNPLSQI